MPKLQKQPSLHWDSLGPELLEAAHMAASLFETYCMQDMEPEELEQQLDDVQFARTMATRAWLKSLIDRAEK
jgi:hypothetical protein